MHEGTTKSSLLHAALLVVIGELTSTPRFPRSILHERMGEGSILRASYLGREELAGWSWGRVEIEPSTGKDVSSSISIVLARLGTTMHVPLEERESLWLFHKNNRDSGCISDG